jgi:hypothetical protein
VLRYFTGLPLSYSSSVTLSRRWKDKHKVPQVGLRAEESARFAPTFGMTVFFRDDDGLLNWQLRDHRSHE